MSNWRLATPPELMYWLGMRSFTCKLYLFYTHPLSAAAHLSLARHNAIVAVVVFRGMGNGIMALLPSTLTDLQHRVNGGQFA